MAEDEANPDTLQLEPDEAMKTEDAILQSEDQPDVPSNLPASDPSEGSQEVVSDYCIASVDDDGNEAIVTELTANSRRKTMIHKKRLSALGITPADDEQMMAQEMFVSIANNQFKRNGKGSFGTFLF